jgi:hypothetical protein
MSQQPSQSATFKIGALFGVVWGVILVANGIVSNALNIKWTSIVTIVVSLAIYFLSGMQASQRTAKVSSGLLAGLVTALFSSLIANATSFVLFATNSAKVEQARQAAQQAAQQAGAGQTITYSDTAIIALTAGGLVVSLIFATLVGLGIGALGGLAGKARAPISQTGYQESMYQGIPSTPYGAPGYPQYPQGPQGQMPGAYPPPPPPGQGWPQQPPPGQGQ